jgi:site-specific recombinase XerD
VITVNGVEDHGFGAVWPVDGTGDRLLVDPAKWKVGNQATTKRDDPVNDALQQLKAHILDIYRQQRQVGQPDLKSIRYELRHGMSPVWSNGFGWRYSSEVLAPAVLAPTDLSGESLIIDAYRKYVDLLESRTGSQTQLSPITLGRWNRTLLLLDKFASSNGQTPPTLSGLSAGWAKRFHLWLQDKRIEQYGFIPLHSLQANRFLSKLREVMQWAYEETWVDKNPLTGIKWPRSAEKKEIRFLEVEQVRLLMQVDWQGTEGAALWWFLLMCYTGLDYPDAVAYAHDRSAYEKLGPAGWKIVGCRAKNGSKYYVPLRPEVLTLFERYPEGSTDFTPQCVNRQTKRIEQLLGISWRITVKTARKTFGCLMLSAGYQIADVSGMMGHSTIAMTERHYVRVSETHIDSAMLRVEGTPSG